MLQFLARELGSMHVLVLAATRDVDPVPGEPLTTMLAEVAREPVTRRISLRGLSQRDAAEYLQLTAADIASPGLTAELYTETEGNPLFVTETVRVLLLEGLRREPGGAAGLVVPQSVRDVIWRRLARLSGACNQTLAFASVLGREFDLESLARVAEISVDELLETLDEAMTARVIGAVPGVAGRLRFAHVVIRDTLYERLPSARRVRLHRRGVAVLEALYGEHPGAHLAQLTHHSIAARQFDLAVRYAWRAADRALTLLAYEEAARLPDCSRGAGSRRCG
jgi:predicted ATPase